MIDDYQPNLAVHILWHPRCTVAGGYARALFTHLFQDTDDLASHGLRIPVRLWRGGRASTNSAPPGIPAWPPAKHRVVVVLIDEEFIAAAGWLDFLDELAAQIRPQDTVLGVSMCQAALTIQSSIMSSNFIRLHDVEDSLRQLVLVNRVTHALCRITAEQDAPVRVFLSHAKRDGLQITESIRNFLQSGTGVENFFDAQNLLEGSRWADNIRGAAKANVLLAIRTDAYATREWCRTEVLEAKLGGSPVIVVDALDQLEPRGFPYLGNAPSVRWRGDDSPAAMEQLLGVILLETLRFHHFPQRIHDLRQAHQISAEMHPFPTPPELLTVLRLGAQLTPDVNRYLVYPDPPLGTDELALLAQAAPQLTPITPTSLIARR